LPFDGTFFAAARACTEEKVTTDEHGSHDQEETRLYQINAYNTTADPDLKWIFM